MLAYGILADLVVLIHLSFVAFSVAGGLLCMRWKAFVFVHPPAAFWAVVVELAGWTCPLTPVENALRRMSGGVGYSSDFVERYLMPVLYPERLTRFVQITLGLLVLTANVLIYFGVYRKWRREKT